MDGTHLSGVFHLASGGGFGCLLSLLGTNFGPLLLLPLFFFLAFFLFHFSKALLLCLCSRGLLLSILSDNRSMGEDLVLFQESVDSSSVVGMMDGLLLLEEFSSGCKLLDDWVKLDLEVGGVLGVVKILVDKRVLDRGRGTLTIRRWGIG